MLKNKLKILITLMILVLLTNFAYAGVFLTGVEQISTKSMTLEEKNLNYALNCINNINQNLSTLRISVDDFMKYRDVKVSLIGDSIADYSKSSINKYFTNIFIDSVPGREISTLDGVYNNMVNYKKLGDILIVSLGTNAITGIRVDLLEKVYNLLNGKPMIVLSIVIPYNGQERNRNRDIKKFVSEHENCYLADWNLNTKKHSEYFIEDKIHPSAAGQDVYAQLIMKAVIDYMKTKN